MLLYKIYIVISSNITKNLTSAKLSTSNFQHEQKDVSCTATQQRINTKLGCWDKKNCAEELRVIKLSMKNLKCLASFIFSLYIFCFLIPSFLSLLSPFHIPRIYICVWLCLQSITIGVKTIKRPFKAHIKWFGI